MFRAVPSSRSISGSFFRTRTFQLWSVYIFFLHHCFFLCAGPNNTMYRQTLTNRFLSILIDIFTFVDHYLFRTKFLKSVNTAHSGFRSKRRVVFPVFERRRSRWNYRWKIFAGKWLVQVRGTGRVDHLKNRLLLLISERVKRAHLYNEVHYLVPGTAWD